MDCKMAGVHDYSKVLKRGFGRATDHASADIRAGLLTREQAFELIMQHDGKRPDALDFYLEITGFTENEFEIVLAKFRWPEIARVPDQCNFMVCNRLD